MAAPNFTAADFLGALQSLLPSGRAWPRDPDSVQTSVQSGLTPTLERQTARSNYLLKDAFPSTTMELLPEWQATLGLPDPHLPPATTLAEQQAQVVAKFANTGGQSAAYFQAYAATLGVSLTVQNSGPFRCGQSKCGQSLGTTDQLYVWNVHAPDKSLEGLFNALKPAHTIVNFITP